ncbi:MAG TPA: DMT family transporter [Terriglobia bacterium]|nr:DMT family transporter [Terriglobia bacterium]
MKSAVEPVVLPQKTSFPVRTHHLMHLAMVIAVFCWAANMVAVKEALFGFSPMALTLVRAIAVAATYAILFLLLRNRSLLRLTRQQWLHFVVIAFFGVTINQILFIFGVAYTNIPHAALIIAVEPVMVLVLSVVMRLEVLTALKFAGMAISLTGVALLTYGKPAQGSQAYWLGDLIDGRSRGICLLHDSDERSRQSV